MSSRRGHVVGGGPHAAEAGAFEGAMYQARGYYRPQSTASCSPATRGSAPCAAGHSRARSTSTPARRRRAGASRRYHGASVSGQPPGDGPSFFVQSLPGSFSDLGPLGREVSLDPGSVLWKEGDPGDHVVLLLEGRLEVSHQTPDGEEITIRHLYPGAVAGEMAALDGQARSATYAPKGSRLADPRRELPRVPAEAAGPARAASGSRSRVRSLTWRVSRTHHRAITDPDEPLQLRLLPRAAGPRAGARPAHGRPRGAGHVRHRPLQELQRHARPPGGQPRPAEGGGAAQKTGRRGDVLARYGGEEFVALLYGATASDGWRFAEAFRSAVASQGFPGESAPAPRAHHRERRRRDVPLRRAGRHRAHQGRRRPPLPSEGLRPQRNGGTGDSNPREQGGGRAPGRRRPGPRARGACGEGLGDPGRRDRPRDRAGHPRQRPLRRAAPVRPAEGRPGVRGGDHAPRSRPPREGRSLGPPEARRGGAETPRNLLLPRRPRRRRGEDHSPAAPRRPVEVVAAGDPAPAPPALAPLGVPSPTFLALPAPEPASVRARPATR